VVAARLDDPLVRSVTATPDPPPVGIANPIHAEDGALGAGYAGALVAGVRTYGLVAESVVEVLGASWLEDGWADVTMRRPVYAGDQLTIAVERRGSAGASAVEVRAEDRVVLDGTVGLGPAAWLDDVDPPAPEPARDPPMPRPTYTIEDAPIGRALQPLGAYVTAEGARRLRLDDLGQTSSHVPDGCLHPWFLAGRMAPLTRHNFTYGPTIHVRTQIQHRGLARAEQEVVIGARIVEVYDRKDHWYQVLDGLVVGGGGATGSPELARIRHHSIFRPRGTVMPAPGTVTETA
jgi:hypothetical protein